MTKKILLIEIGTEELPAKLLSSISLSFYKNLNEELKLYTIVYKKIEYFSTPRRLALKIIDIDTTDKTIEINKKGPSIIDAYDKDGAPTNAANRWAKYCGININEATRIKTKQGEWLFCQKKIKQKKIEILLPKIIDIALKKIIIQKSMRWNVTNEKFFRPIRNIVILLDRKVIKGKIFDVFSNNFLQNHISCQEKIEIKDAKEYPLILFQRNNIIADYAIRKKTIINQINKISEKINGYIKTSNNLIEEITSLVESPTALLGTFKKNFLKIPKKILVHVIESQQKCFPIYNVKNELFPNFIFISNIDSKKPNKIILGNEKVMDARLSDAAFFLQNDRKIKLEDYLMSLKKVLFQNNLGTLYDKTLRLQILIQWISKYSCINIQDAIRAAQLSKCDLVTSMVCEFPALQGTVGMYYSLSDKEKKDVSQAIQEQYSPSFSGDKLPSTMIGCSLAIADKMDTLSGMFCIGNIPTSAKDPFALRRLAIGILRIIIIKNIPLDLKCLINKSLSLYNIKYVNDVIIYNKIIKFFMNRLVYWYEENSYDIKVIQSVLSSQLTEPRDIHKKIQAISFFQNLEYSKSIIQSIKRISNILKKEKEKITGHVDIQLIQEKEEIVLFSTIKKFHTDTKKLFQEKKYKEILLKTKVLEKPIYNFFDKVKIHHSNIKIRINRLILLKKIESIFTKITNFSYLY
ncbi:glycine--tRNA ligase subunit beta [Buchnera aphidicola]|uniref:Glycine--tRNA ligase beta subunit n=1 Tax=Buchnera aphidicola str. USDA (Myzus persicae) TaxID=1009856 RepID=W0P4F2_BUCMP|nr:glycine--tRNA ligase subunit beta [Buchnera aphidicola]AHG60235.1 GlyS [Buchnera aphidicola str. USDA (Myzus persicae)]AHG60813.1 Glys [Buchnera aphidicola str. W106 (Myzus persicae)]AHG61385.1 GlyS [Buchnera aphidicola str. G002 (Myzus persicae)]AHG61958.1 Glys [Buchnera aphidicola str. F009 (Myzus persicae)]